MSNHLIPKKYCPIDLDQTQQDLQLSFPGAYAELAERKFTADILTGANKLRNRAESIRQDPKSEWDKLFQKTAH